MGDRVKTAEGGGGAVSLMIILRIRMPFTPVLVPEKAVISNDGLAPPIEGNLIVYSP